MIRATLTKVCLLLALLAAALCGGTASAQQTNIDAHLLVEGPVQPGGEAAKPDIAPLIAMGEEALAAEDGELADALALGAEEGPDLMVSMATLTGAARVAVGPDLSPYYTDDTALAGLLDTAAEMAADPVWRMPFHAPYESMIEPGIADLDNAPKGGFAGSITAALFLRRFAGQGRYAHFDIYGWNPAAAPARPKGGVGMGARALLEALPGVLAL